MFEKFTSAGSRDFQQRYQGTYGFFRDGDVRELSQLVRVNTDASPPYVEFRGADGRLFYIRADSKHENRGFQFLPPKSAYYNTEDGVPLLVQRIPARQYLRGVCDRNTQITNMSGDAFPVDFENLTKLFLKKVSIATAVEAMEKVYRDKSAAGIAISQQFAISIPFGRIKCFNATIGRCDYKDKTFNVTLDDPDMWLTEVTDAFHRANLKATVK